MVSWSNPDIPGLRSVGPPLPHSGNAERKHSFLREVFPKLCSGTNPIEYIRVQGWWILHLSVHCGPPTAAAVLWNQWTSYSNAQAWIQRLWEKVSIETNYRAPRKRKKYLVLQKQSPKPTVVYSGTRNLKRRPLCIDFAKQTSQSQKDIMKALQNCLYRINTQGSFSQYKAILALVEVHIGINVLPHWSQLI